MIEPADAHGLFDSLADLFVMPASHRVSDVDRKVALELLSCDEDTLTELVRQGLPASEVGEELRFDQRDLFNLALYSGSGRTPPELAFRYALRWMTSSTSELVSKRRWSLAVDVRCHDECGEKSETILARPIPHIYAGEEKSMTTTGVSDATGICAQGGVHLQSDVVVVGEIARIHSQQIRDVYEDFLAHSLRWVKLPAALQVDVEMLVPHGVASCVTASLYLEHLCHRSGLTARTRRGWVLGMLDLVHAWVEVVDDDGATKILDPIFGLFSAALPDANPLLRDTSVSARTNRLLPTSLTATEPLATHHCGSVASLPSVTAEIFPLPLAGVTV